MQVNKKLLGFEREEFQNKKPEYTIIQLSRYNIIKNTSIWIILFVSFFIFSFLIGYIFDGVQNYEISKLDATISIWGFMGFILSFWFISYTRRFKYELSLINYLHNLILIVFFTLIYTLYKVHIFGNINNSKLHPDESINAIKILFYTWLSIIAIINISWYLTTFMNKKKYYHVFIKSSFLILPLFIFLFTPFLITNFNSAFFLEKETIFWTMALCLILIFVLFIGILSKYQTFGENNLQLVNSIFGFELSYAYLGGVVGSITYLIYKWFDELSLNLFSIISLIISITLLIIFASAILYKNKKESNSFFNKVMLKTFVIINLLITIILTYLSTINKQGNKLIQSIEIMIFSLISIFIFFLIMGPVFKLIIFNRWQSITKISNFLIAFFFIIFQASIATLEDAEILYTWLGRSLLIIILSLYALIEIVSFLPELFVAIQITNKKNVIMKDGK